MTVDYIQWIYDKGIGNEDLYCFVVKHEQTVTVIIHDSLIQIFFFISAKMQLNFNMIFSNPHL